MGIIELDTENPTKFRFSYYVSSKIGKGFYELGFFIANHPWKTISFSWLIVAICASGLFFFHIEKDPLKLWIPKESRFLRDTEWLTSHFEEGTRVQSFLIVAPNVLTEKVLQKAMIIHDYISQFTIEDKENTILNFEDLCFKIPIILGFSSYKRRRKRDPTYSNNSDILISQGKNVAAKRPFLPSIDMEPTFYCDLVNSMPLGCMQESLLELWKFDSVNLNKTTKVDVLQLLNNIKFSPYSGHKTDYTHLLGGIERDKNGKIISAKSLLSNYMLHVNFSENDASQVGNMAGTEDWSSLTTMKWELRFLSAMKKLKNDLDDDNFTVYYSAGRSYGDISNDTMFQDMDKLVISVIIMAVFMQFVLSKYGWTEIRIGLGSLGLMSVGMAFISGCGICSVIGISYGPVHTSLPFLLMGLGVDDMFVMMSYWRNIQKIELSKSPEERMGLMLQQAGAAITITSVTSIIAFLVGSYTILPSLQSFCLYASVCVFMMYFYVITFYVSIFVLDERRIAQRRNSFIPIIIHSEGKAKICIESNLMYNFLKKLYLRILTKTGKANVILFVICLTSFNVYSLTKLRQKFDPSWFIPENTYLGNYLQQTREFYPNRGNEAFILVGQINYTEDMYKIINLYEEVANQTDILHEVQGWPPAFYDFVQTYHEQDSRYLTDDEWRLYLSQFLFSNQGGRYQSDFRFEKKLKCGVQTPNITVSQIAFKFKKFFDREDYLPAKQRIDNLVANAHLDSGEGFSTVWGRIFGNWITDEIIDTEIYRNLGLALIGVMTCTAVIIVNFQVCLWIFVSVLLTLVNVGGSMQMCGLTLDIVSFVALTLSVGICVDHSVHIAHTFLTINQGNRNERALNTILQIGGAVLYGGMSTILALVMLYGSQAYMYRSFFRIFFFIVLYGLLHGVVLLPVILSIVGPRPYKKHLKADSNEIRNAKDSEMETIKFVATDEDK